MPSRGAIRTTLATLLALTLAAIPAAAATADTGTNWWYDYYQVEKVHSEGWTGAGVKVAVIDSQINSQLPVFRGAKFGIGQHEGFCGGDADTTDLNEGSQHGSTVSALMVGNGTGAGDIRGIAPNATVTYYGFGTKDSCPAVPETSDKLSAVGQAIQAAVDDGNTIITTSVGFALVSRGDVGVIAKALANGVVVIAATINDKTDINEFPASVNGVVSVNAIDSAGAIQQDHVYSSETLALTETTVVAAGVDMPSVGDTSTGSWDGTQDAYGASLAAPLVAGMLALTKQKYPRATNNQLIQSLIHNTTTKDHPLTRDTTGGYGYGPASLTHLLEVDPSAYPDKNPLMDKSFGSPKPDQVVSGGKPDHSSSASPTPAPSASSSSGSGTAVWLVALVVAGVLVAIALVVFIVVLSRRHSRTNRGGIK